MTFKMPETNYVLASPARDYEREYITHEDGYTADQLRDAYNAGVEDAAKVCLSDWSTGEEMAAGHVFYDAIRTLKEQANDNS